MMGSPTILESEMAPESEGHSVLPGAAGSEPDGPSVMVPGRGVSGPGMIGQSRGFVDPRPYNPNRRPTYVRDSQAVSPARSTPMTGSIDTPGENLGLIGPIGYDVRPENGP